MSIHQIQFQHGMAIPEFLNHFGTEALKRDLGVSYPTAWLLHYKNNSAMSP